MKNLFYEVRRNRMCEDVVEQIQIAILEGAVALGASMPAEQGFRDRFQVSGESFHFYLPLQESHRLTEEASMIIIIGNDKSKVAY